jgi:hypothetical protein
MRIALWTVLLALNIGGIVCAQAPMPSPLQTTSGTGFTGVPYSGKEITSIVQTAANGVKNTSTSVTLLWRDNEGRTRQEHLQQTPSGAEYRSVVITDPVAGVYLKWTIADEPASHTVTIWPMPARQRVTAPPPAAAPTVSGQQRCGPECSREALTPQMINGVYAEGTRTKRIVQTGAAGSNQSLMTTNELWISPDLRIIVRHVMDNPLGGLTTTNVTDVVRSDPDPALFVAPEGYVVRDTRQNPSSLN